LPFQTHPLQYRENSVLTSVKEGMILHS